MMSPAQPAHDPPADPVDLAAENARLLQRVAVAEAEIDRLRAEALERRAEIRSMAEALPAAMSRHALLRSMTRDALHHPDKRGVAARGARKLGRAPRKAVRIVLRRPQP